MTPSQKLDRIIAEGYAPDVSAVVNVAKYKYVWRTHGGIRVGDWLIPIPYGFMSDGDSCVPDRQPLAYFGHDRLYASPWAIFKGVVKELTKRQCDWMYSKIGIRKFNLIVFLRGLFLATGINNRVWKLYRERDQAALIESKIVPKAMCWDFPTQYTRDAVWVGAV